MRKKTPGPPVRDMGIWFTTRMTVVKLSDDSIWMESPIPVSFDTLKQIINLGPVRYLVAATPRHVWRLDSYHTLFPEAQLWACPKTSFTLQKGPLPFAGILGETAPESWANDLDQLPFQGNPYLSEVLFLHKESRTVIIGDLIQIHRPKNNPFYNALFKFEGVLSPQGGVGLDLRLSFINRKLARQSLEKLLSWDFDKLIIAHGPCIEKDAKKFMKQAFRWLIP
jgi:hypothetical protein